MGKRKMSLDLSEIEGLIYVMQRAPEKIHHSVRNIANEWAEKTKSEYDVTTGYSLGFKKCKGPSFSRIDFSDDGKDMRIAVGHKAFIARFLEVGTKAHQIPKRSGQGYFEHPSVKGTKALSKVIKNRKNDLIRKLENTISEAFKRG